MTDVFTYNLQHVFASYGQAIVRAMEGARPQLSAWRKSVETAICDMRELLEKHGFTRRVPRMGQERIVWTSMTVPYHRRKAKGYRRHVRLQKAAARR